MVVQKCWGSRQYAETVNALREKFDLDPQYAALLDQSDFDNIQQDGMQFLEALDRVRAIRRELSTLDVFQEDQRLGATSAIRMMEALAAKQERAYERLYHWLQTHLHLNSQQQQEVDPDAMDEALSHPFVRQALITLQHVPAFYSHTLEMIATSRRLEVTRRFLLALTSGYDGNAPMEMKAHDPVSYVGDMLAFCFQCCSVEADNVRRIVICDEDNVENHDENAITEEIAMTAADMLAHAMSGIAWPLKSRLLQVVASLAC